MKVCDECREPLGLGIAVSMKFGYGSRLYDGDEFEFCSDKCFFKWGAKESTRFLRLCENPHCELDDLTLSKREMESLAMLREYEREQHDKIQLPKKEKAKRK